MKGDSREGNYLNKNHDNGIYSKSKRNKKDIQSLYDKEIFMRLAKYALPYWRWFLLALVLVLFITAMTIIRPYIIKIGIDKYIQGAVDGAISLETAEEGILKLSAVFLSFLFLELIFGYLQTYILQATGKSIIMNLRNNIFGHIQRLPIKYFDKNAVGRIVTRVTNDTETLNEMYTDILVGFLQDVFVMIGIIAVMFSLSGSLSLVSITVVPLMVISAMVFRKNARKVFGEIRSRLGAINAFLSEHVSGMKIIQVFNMQKKKYIEFDGICKDYMKANDKMIMIIGVFRPIMDILNSLALALLLWFGGKGILGGTLEVGTLFAFINYTNRFFQPIMNLTERYNTLQSSVVASERIFSLLNETPESQVERLYKKKKDEVRTSKLNGDIEFRNVWFAYNDENWVLKNISFKISSGEAVAFVGATGAGKTSIINLICGFYEIQKGEILIDGINIKDIRKSELRLNIGLVLQDVFLFSGNIKDNIRLGNNNITDEKIYQIAKYVNAHSFIERMGGYNSLLSEKGATLSSGQRQLISFARALINEPRILVMDEATSNIDTETEGLIQDALSKIMKDRTTIAIAHRLSTIQEADKIIVIHNGEILEMGNHQELLDREGMYYNLYRLQYSIANA